MKNHRDKENFRYVELDIHETADGELAVFHDKKIGRMVPLQKFGNSCVIESYLSRTGEKRKKDYPLAVFTKTEIRRFNLSVDSVKIPFLEDVFSALKEFDYKGRVFVETKDIRTEKTRKRLLELLTANNEHFDLSVLAGGFNFGRCFPDKKTWCDRLRRENIETLWVGVHTRVCAEQPKSR